MEPTVAKYSIAPEQKTENNSTFWRKLMKLIKKCWPIAICLVFAIILISDIHNVPSKLGVPMSKLNLNWQSIFVNNGVVVFVFWLGYHLIEKGQLKKEANKNRMVLVLLHSTYMQCQTLITRFTDEDFLDDLCNHGADPNNIEDPTLLHFRMLPFMDSHEMIVTLAQDGIMEEERMKTYLKIKEKFGSFVDEQIIKYQADDTPKADKELNELLNEEIEDLKAKLK